MDEDTGVTQEWVQLSVHPRARPGELKAGTPWFVASAVQDAIQVGDEVLLLHGSRPVRLQGIGATLWLACREGATESALSDAVIAAHGHHPEADRIVSAAIAELVERGVLDMDPPSAAG